MCDTYAAECVEEGCPARLPVHIGDFCVPRDTVEARCMEHPPPEPEGWWAFDGCMDLDEDNEPTIEFGTMYLRYIGGAELLVMAAETDRAMMRSIGLDESYATGYRVGNDGNICPNLVDYTERRVTEPFDGKKP